MSDSTNEAEGVGAADPITGVTAAKDDLASTAQLPDSEADVDDLEDAADEDASADYAADDPEAIEAESMDTVTTDGVAGDTVYPGRGDGNDGPTGGAPEEITPIQPENELDPDSIDLDDQR